MENWELVGNQGISVRQGYDTCKTGIRIPSFRRKDIFPKKKKSPYAGKQLRANQKNITCAV